MPLDIKLKIKSKINKKIQNYNKGRDLRPNSDGWRMLATEFCMINGKLFKF